MPGNSTRVDTTAGTTTRPSRGDLGTPAAPGSRVDSGSRSTGLAPIYDGDSSSSPSTGGSSAGSSSSSTSAPVGEASGSAGAPSQ
jgi:hypothetical protein